MNITYSTKKDFTQTQLEELFKSVNWVSANYSDRLVKAMSGSTTVISAWDGDRLIGLVNALDDGELTAYVHYLLVNPDYHGNGIGRELALKIKERYVGYLYIVLIAESKENISFYETLGFKVTEGATPVDFTTF